MNAHPRTATRSRSRGHDDAPLCRAGDASLTRLSRSFASSGTIDTARDGLEDPAIGQLDNDQCAAGERRGTRSLIKSRILNDNTLVVRLA